MSKPDAVGCMIQWAVELSQFDIKYRPRMTIKAQPLVDFIAEFTLPNSDQESEYWMICTNGLSVIGLSIIVTSPKKDTLKYGV